MMQLIPFAEASRRLALSRRTYLGLQEIPVERIVGSLDRSDDFRRDFRAHDATADLDAAASQARKTSRHERSRREVRREGSRPLPCRHPHDTKE